MGLLDSFAKNQDATRDWAAEPGLRMRFDFDRNALLDVPLGDPFRGLFRLGPAEDTEAAKSGELRYFSRGVAVTVEKDRCHAYFLVFAEGFEGYAPFHGACTWKGQELVLTSFTSREELIQAFGPLDHEEADEDETILYWQHPGIEWQAELEPSGHLRCILVRRTT